MKLCRILSLVTSLVLVSCVEKSGPAVRIIVPIEFRGLIRIVEEKAGGTVPIESEEFVYRIPTNGVLSVKEAVGFAQWHQQYADFSSGLPLMILSTDAPDDGSEKVALYSFGRSQKQIRFFVGTKAELVQFLKSPAGASGF